MTIAADSTAAAPVLLPPRTFLKQYSISKSGMSAGRGAARFSPRAVLALPTLDGFSGLQPGSLEQSSRWGCAGFPACAVWQSWSACIG
jgi:hypothetical protein